MKSILIKTARAIGVFIAASYFTINLGILLYSIKQLINEMIRYYNL